MLYEGESWWGPRIVATSRGLVVSGEGTAIAYSTDGRTFQSASVPELTRVTRMHAVGETVFAEAMHDCCFGEVPEAVEVFTLVSDTLSEWRAEAEVDAWPSCETPASEWGAPAGRRGAVIEGGGLFIDLHCDGEGRVFSEDGVIWQTLELPPSAAAR